MIPSPPLDAVELVLVIVEAILYGIYLVLLISALEAFHQRKKRAQPYALLLCVSLCLFCTISAHLVLDVARTFDAFIKVPRTSPFTTQGNDSLATIYFEDLSATKYVAASAFYVVTTVVGDAFMIYRLYVVWSRSWRILVLPVISFIVMCVAGGIILSLVSHMPKRSIFAIEGGWISVWFVLTLVTNLTSALLIASKVWLSKRNITALGTYHFSAVQRVMNALVQSAALYTLCLILSLAFYATKNNIQFIFASINCPVVGIAFALIASRSGGASEDSSGCLESHSLQHVRPLAPRITREIITYTDSVAENGFMAKPFSEGGSDEGLRSLALVKMTSMGTPGANTEVQDGLNNEKT